MDSKDTFNIMYENEERLKREIEQMISQNILFRGLVKTFYTIHREDFLKITGTNCFCIACNKAEKILNPPIKQNCPDCD